MLMAGTGDRLPNLHGRFRRDERRVREVVHSQAGEELRCGQGAAEGGARGDGVCCAALMCEILGPGGGGVGRLGRFEKVGRGEGGKVGRGTGKGEGLEWR